jgi:hypothetical protein
VKAPGIDPRMSERFLGKGMCFRRFLSMLIAVFADVISNVGEGISLVIFSSIVEDSKAILRWTVLPTLTMILSRMTVL